MADPPGSSLAAAERGPTILQVLPALGEQGGVERGTVDVAAAIVDAGGRAVVASAGGARVPNLLRIGAHHASLPMASKNPLVMFRNTRRLEDLIRTFGVDVVHARSRAPAWSAWEAARRAGVPFVTTFHGTYGGSTSLKLRYNGIMVRGRLVIAISRFIAEHVHQVYGVPWERIRVIHRGVDLEHFDPRNVSVDRIVTQSGRFRLNDGLPLILLPGRLTRWKGQRVLIEAMRRLGRSDVQCILLGSDQGRRSYRAELEGEIVKAGLGGVVRIIDRADDLAAAYMLSDVVVSASTEPEAFGRVLVEAQALGRPVIGSDHGGSRETVLPGVTGWLTPPGDADALAAAIDEALSLAVADRHRLGEAAMAHVRTHFTRERMCRETLAVYDEVLAEGAAR
ncbi:MAG: glycosyltransferase [Rhodospirillales bacterium]|nr:MAG: glycosyltransferase [Rhodospirillales bacterium]